MDDKKSFPAVGVLVVSLVVRGISVPETFAQNAIPAVLAPGLHALAPCPESGTPWMHLKDQDGFAWVLRAAAGGRGLVMIPLGIGTASPGMQPEIPVPGSGTWHVLALHGRGDENGASRSVVAYLSDGYPAWGLVEMALPGQGWVAREAVRGPVPATLPQVPWPWCHDSRDALVLGVPVPWGWQITGLQNQAPVWTVLAESTEPPVLRMQSGSGFDLARCLTAWQAGDRVMVESRNMGEPVGEGDDPVWSMRVPGRLMGMEETGHEGVPVILMTHGAGIRCLPDRGETAVSTEVPESLVSPDEWPVSAYRRPGPGGAELLRGRTSWFWLESSRGWMIPALEGESFAGFDPEGYPLTRGGGMVILHRLVADGNGMHREDIPEPSFIPGLAEWLPPDPDLLDIRRDRQGKAGRIITDRTHLQEL